MYHQEIDMYKLTMRGRNRKCRLLFLRQTIMVKGFVSKKAGSHKLKAFSRAREVALISNP